MNREASLGVRAGLLVAALALTTTACGSSAGSENGSAAGGTSGNAAAEPAARGAAQEFDSGAAQHGTGQGGTAKAASDVQQRSVISTGTIVLDSRDVTSTRARIDAVLKRLGGRVADENTQTDDDGTVTSSRLVVRVPSGRFDDAMTSLSSVASLRSASRKADDVTTQVIDVHARILAERAGVRRLRQLVSRTASLSALLEVEQALTQRQGELQSLRQQRAYLSDQTSEATITVDVSRRTTPTPVGHAAGGFVGGLGHGWRGLVAVVTGLLLAVGALIPFAVALALVGLPAWLVVRRMRRGRRPSPAVES